MKAGKEQAAGKNQEFSLQYKKAIESLHGKIDTLSRESFAEEIDRIARRFGITRFQVFAAIGNVDEQREIMNIKDVKSLIEAAIAGRKSIGKKEKTPVSQSSAREVPLSRTIEAINGDLLANRLMEEI